MGDVVTFQRPAKPAVRRQSFWAAYAGECGLCLLGIRPGDVITRIEAAEAPYAHLDCDDCDDVTSPGVDVDPGGVLGPNTRAAIREVLRSPEYRRLEHATGARSPWIGEGDDDGSGNKF